MNSFGVILQKPLTPYLHKELPFGLDSFEQYNSISWYLSDRYHLHEELGNKFINVKPGMIEMHSVDSAVDAQIFGRQADFEKSELSLRAVKLFGESVTSVTGYHWQRRSTSAIVWGATPTVGTVGTPDI